MSTNPILENATEEELGRYHASPSSPIFKGAYRTNLMTEESDEAIAETVAWFKERNAPFSSGGPEMTHNQATWVNEWWHKVFPYSRKMPPQWLQKSIS